jgi:tripartite-type tricarboxylate transporter receptor subunit TctC
MLSKTIGAVIVIGLTLMSFNAIAQNYPSRAITVVVPYPAGSGSDIATRMMVTKMQELSGKQMVIDNRAGAAGITGAISVMNSPPDGYTFLMTGSSSHALAKYLFKAATYDPVKDFTHVVIASLIPFTIAVPANSKYASITNLVEALKANPGRLKWGYASGGPQSVGRKFLQVTNATAAAVPYKAPQEALTDMYQGLIDFVVVDALTGVNLSRGDQAKLLVILSAEKSKLLPDTPSMVDAGLSPIYLIGFTGFAAPAGIPEEARRWFAETFRKAITDPGLLEQLKKNAVDPVSKQIDPAEFIRQQVHDWGQAAQEAGIKAQ